MIKLFWTAFIRLSLRLLGRPMWLLLLISVSLMSLVYSNGTIIDLPIAVVDMDHTTSSRDLIRSLDTSAKIKVKLYDNSWQAYQDINERKLFAVIMIPRNFEKRLLSGETITIPAYGDASSRLVNGLIQRDLQTIYQQILTNFNTKIMLNNGFSPNKLALFYRR